MSKIDVHKLRNILVIISTVLMVALVVFQWIEIKEYNIQDHMWERIAGLFKSDAPAAPAAPTATAPAAAAPAAPEGTPAP